MLSGKLERLPWLLAVLLVVGFCSVALLFARPIVAGAILGLACGLDLALLLSLPRLGVAQGPARPPWLLFAAGRALLSAAIPLAPLSVAGELAMLAAIQAALLALCLYATLWEPFWIEETQHRLPVRGLGGPLRLLLLSDLELGATRLQILGVSADGSHGDRGVRLEALAASSDPALPRLCLHHTPDLIEEAARLGLDLYLAGHTHGGQICVPLLGPLVTASRFGRRYARGLRRVDGMTAYVSRGLGLEGLGAPRMRFLARPELAWLELEPGA